MRTEFVLKSSPEEQKHKFSNLRTFSDVADLLEVKPEYLNHLLFRMGTERYNIFEIPKKKPGQFRIISSPIAPIKIIQYKLKQVLDTIYEPRCSAYGFIHGKDIVDNAKVHKKPRYVLNIDLKDFFPSIHFGRVEGLFKKPPYNLPQNAARTLAQICCFNDGLPQGAPTSPIISNMICNKLDSQLQRLAQKHRCYYTRYADDITFSTTMRSFPSAIASLSEGKVNLGFELSKILEANRFEVNTEKIRLQTSEMRQEVTGLTVNKFPNVRRKFIRQIHAMLFAWNKYGYEAAEREYLEKYNKKSRFPGKSKLSFEQVVLGKIEFLGMVRGGKKDAMYRRFKKEWGELSGKEVTFPDDEDDKKEGSMETRPAQIFLSYASENYDTVKNIYDRLKKAGYSPWLDKESIVGGEDWDKAIKRAIDRTDLFVFCLSKQSANKRGWIQKEIIAALDKLAEKLDDDIFIIPLRLEECDIPERLAKIQYIDYFQKNGWDRLVQSIGESLRRAEEKK